MTDHFPLSEFTASAKARELGIRNEPNKVERDRLRRVAVALEAVRHVLGASPLIISSGYRCAALNKAVGGAPTSFHRFGAAADFQLTTRDARGRLIPRTDSDSYWSAYGTLLRARGRGLSLAFEELYVETAGDPARWWFHLAVPVNPGVRCRSRIGFARNHRFVFGGPS